MERLDAGDAAHPARFCQTDHSGYFLWLQDRISYKVRADTYLAMRVRCSDAFLKKQGKECAQDCNLWFHITQQVMGLILDAL